MAKKKRSVTLAILRCPQHDFYCVAVGSLRISRSKCCGSWSQVVREWTCDTKDLMRDFNRAVKEI